jgi:hypothetical protein
MRLNAFFICCVSIRSNQSYNLGAGGSDCPLNPPFTESPATFMPILGFSLDKLLYFC